MKQSYNELNEEDVKKMFKKLDTPDMRDDIIDAVHGKKKHSPKRLKLRAVSGLAAAFVFTVAVSATTAVGIAVASGKFEMKVGTLEPYEKTAPDGSVVQMNRYDIKLEEVSGDENAPDKPLIEFSEKALANFEPMFKKYTGETKGINREFTTFFKTVEEAEKFVDKQFYIPGKYRAYCENVKVMVADWETKGVVAHLTVTTGNKLGDTIDIALTDSTWVVRSTSGEIEKGNLEYTLPDGTRAIAVMIHQTSDRGTRYRANVEYLRDNIRYSYTETDYTTYDNRERIVEKIAETLATVTDQPVDPADWPEKPDPTTATVVNPSPAPVYIKEFAGMTYKGYDPEEQEVDGMKRVYDRYMIHYNDLPVNPLYTDETLPEEVKAYIGKEYKENVIENLETVEKLFGMKFHLPAEIRDTISEVYLSVNDNGRNEYRVTVRYRYETDGVKLYSNINLNPLANGGFSSFGYLDEPYTYELDKGAAFVTICNTENEGKYDASIDYLYEGIAHHFSISHYSAGEELDTLLERVERIIDEIK